MLERVLEPEVMDDPDEAASYDEMGHDPVNVQFVADLLAGGDLGRNVLDLGTGTARIPIELCKTDEECRVLALDAAVSMLDIARHNVIQAGFELRIDLAHQNAASIEWNDEPFDCVISNSLVHHVPDPKQPLSEMVRVLRPGGRIFVRDLFRPDNAESVEELVATYAADETPENQQLLRQSFFAALTLDEIQKLVSDIGFDPSSVKMSSDRHWTWDAIKPNVDAPGG